MKKLAVVDVNMRRGHPASTFRVGFLPKGTKYKDVVEVFGKPRDVWPEDEQVKAQWVGEINKQTFTIYDYNTGKSLGSNTDWNIGGHDDSVGPLVLDYFIGKSGKASMVSGKEFDRIFPSNSDEADIAKYIKQEYEVMIKGLEERG